MGQSFFEIIPMKSAGILLPSGTSLKTPHGNIVETKTVY